MTEPSPNQSVRLNDEDWDLAPFVSCSAFCSVGPAEPEESSPVGHDPRHDVELESAPTLFDRSNRDDVERAQAEAMEQLSGVVDDHCLRTVLRQHHAAVDVAARDLNDWIAQAALDVLLDTRKHTGLDIVLDTELRHFVDRRLERDHRMVGFGTATGWVYGMARHGSFAEPFYVIVAEPDLLGLSSRLALYLASHVLGDAEYLSARCDLAYAPRLDAGALRIARVRFPDEAAWRAEVVAHLGNRAQ
ncbi:MAG: hypothetical protein QM572_09395 [Nocardioides sp.]|uniref:hypothetical protein n=1 Tax=Nocardioides sp. TaxID=35761 RepID=UPI0039E5831E